MSPWDEWLAGLPAAHAALAVEQRRRMRNAAVEIARVQRNTPRRHPPVAFFTCRGA